MPTKRCLVFGGFGAIGSAVAREFEKNSFEVWRTSRSWRANEPKSLVAVGDGIADGESFNSLPQFDAVVWAQGSNLNDSIVEYKADEFDEVLNANVKFVASTLSSLLIQNKILPGVIDTPMTRGVLTEKQVLSVGERTSFGRLVRPEELANVIFFLCSDLNSCITGQSIVADLGFANVRPI